MLITCAWYSKAFDTFAWDTDWNVSNLISPLLPLWDLIDICVYSGKVHQTDFQWIMNYILDCSSKKTVKCLWNLEIFYIRHMNCSVCSVSLCSPFTFILWKRVAWKSCQTSPFRVYIDKLVRKWRMKLTFGVNFSFYQREMPKR